MPSLTIPRPEDAATFPRGTSLPSHVIGDPNRKTTDTKIRLKVKVKAGRQHCHHAQPETLGRHANRIARHQLALTPKVISNAKHGKPIIPLLGQTSLPKLGVSQTWYSQW